MDDVELLTRWHEGHQEAGRELFQRYFKPVSRFFRGKVNTDVSDLVQDTFTASLEGHHRLREISNFRAYLFGVARNVLHAHLRHKYRGGAIVDFTGVSVQDLAPGPITQITQRREQRLLLEALRRIPIDYQILLEMRYWQQLAIDDIAQVEEVPAGTIRRRLHQARRLLHEAMSKLAASPAELPGTLADFEEWARQCRDLELVGDD